MSDDLSPRLSLPYLVAGQAQKEVMHNEALQIMDALVQPAALSADLAIPSTSPAMGACWIVGGYAAGEWAGHDGEIAQWTDGGWRFSQPSTGWRCHVIDRDAMMVHDGTAWQNDRVRADGVYIDGARVVGERSASIPDPVGGTVVDSEGRLVVKDILAILREHGLIET